VTDKKPWGHFAPPQQAAIYRALISMGLGRGKLRAKILSRWTSHFGDIVDVSVRGVNYRLNLSDNVTDSKIFASSKIYDGLELDYLSKACRNGTFVDIGANTGYYSLVLAHQTTCRVIAIEPNPQALDRLRFNLGINDALQDRIVIVPLGVGPEGFFDLYLGDSLGVATLSDRESSQKRKISIKTRPLYDILKDQNIQQVDGLKIDIEGMEDRAIMPFFKDAPKSLWPRCLVMEDAHQEYWEHDLRNWLADNGYQQIARTKGNIILQRS